MTGTRPSHNVDNSEMADFLSSTVMETEALYRMAGWDSPIPSTECNGKKLKPRLSAGNAGMDATLKMTHSLGMYVFPCGLKYSARYM